VAATAAAAAVVVTVAKNTIRMKAHIINKYVVDIEIYYRLITILKIIFNSIDI
jgi:hypothetical protein